MRAFTMRAVAIAVLVLAGMLNQASAGEVYFVTPSPTYVAVPTYTYTPVVRVYEPVVVHYSRPVVVNHEPLHVVPSYVPVRRSPFVYSRFSGYRHKEEFKGKPGKYKYQYKAYSPFKLGPVYEFEYKYDRGRIKIEEDFD